MTVCGLDVTKRVWLREASLSQIREAAGSIGSLLEDQVRRWWSSIGAHANNLHDPVAILPAIRPDLFRFEQCDVRVELDNMEPGRTYVDHCGEGAVRIAADIEAEAAEQEIVRRIVTQG